MKQIYCERKPQRRVRRSQECEAVSIFPLVTPPAGNNDDLDDLLAQIDAVLDHSAA